MASSNSESLSMVSGSLYGQSFRTRFFLGLYVVGSRKIERGKASVIGVEPSFEGGTSGSVAEKPWGKKGRRRE